MRLGVNVDHIATIRQARGEAFPSPVEAARLCEQSGAHSIVCHLREDRRHIQDRDIVQLKRSLSTMLNLEMSIAENVVEYALKVRPDQVTLVPERRQELTTEGGLDVLRLRKRLQRVMKKFQKAGIPVSLFIDPSLRQVQGARELGAEIIELHTGRYARARSRSGRLQQLRLIERASQEASRLGLGVAAGHGLDYFNVRPVATIPEVFELNIGFAIISRAVFVGLGKAVREMRKLIR